MRLLREVRERGYAGGVTQFNDFLRTVSPSAITQFEGRFETSSRRQPHKDFAHLVVRLIKKLGVQNRIWLFAILLGHGCYPWAHYVLLSNTSKRAQRR